MKFIATTLTEFLNEKKEIKDNLNDNFWKWFGNSVTIKDGNPIIFHHFSEKKFDIFDKKTGQNINLFTTTDVNREGFFFTTDMNFGSKFGNEIYNVYLKINKLFNFDEHYYYKDINTKTSDFFNEVVDYIEENGIDLTSDYQSYIGELKIKPEYKWKFFDNEIGKYFIDYLKNNEYDGCFFLEEDNSPVYVVFNPEQIKSIENKGTWDINNKNIYS